MKSNIVEVDIYANGDAMPSFTEAEKIEKYIERNSFRRVIFVMRSCHLGNAMSN